MKLVNIHKRYVFLFLLGVGIQQLQAQEWTLNQCIDSALVHNKKLKIDANNILLAKEKQKEISSNLLPKVSATFDYKYYFDLPTQLMPAKAFNPAAPDWQFNAAQFGVPHNINTNIQFGVPLYNAQVYGGIKTTKIASKLREVQYQKSKEEIYVTISNMYYNAQIIKNQLQFVESNIKNASKLLDNLTLLKEQKLVTGTDVKKIDLQVKQLQTQKQLLLSKYSQVINGLQISMGVSKKNITVSSTINYKELAQYTKNKITDIELVETKSALNDSEIKTLKKGKLPTISLYGSYGKIGYGYDVKPNDFLDFYDVSFVGLKINIPVFDLSRKHKIKQKKIEKENTELQLSLLKEQNNIEIETAQKQVAVTKNTIDNTIEQINIAQSIYNNTLLQHKEDTASLTEVLLADNNLKMAQQNYLQAIVDYLKADLELKKVTGNILN